MISRKSYTRMIIRLVSSHHRSQSFSLQFFTTRCRARLRPRVHHPQVWNYPESKLSQYVQVHKDSSSRDSMSFLPRQMMILLVSYIRWWSCGARKLAGSRKANHPKKNVPSSEFFNVSGWIIWASNGCHCMLGLVEVLVFGFQYY